MPLAVQRQRHIAGEREQQRRPVPTNDGLVDRDAGQPFRGKQRVQMAARDVRLRVDVAEGQSRLRQGHRVEERDAMRIVGIEDAAHRLAPEPDRAEQVRAVDVVEVGHHPRA